MEKARWDGKEFGALKLWLSIQQGTSWRGLGLGGPRCQSQDLPGEDTESKQTPELQRPVHDTTAEGGGGPLGFPALLHITSYHRNSTEEYRC